MRKNWTSESNVTSRNPQMSLKLFQSNKPKSKKVQSVQETYVKTQSWRRGHNKVYPWSEVKLVMIFKGNLDINTLQNVLLNY
jgi:hypothetical protein